MRIADLLSPGAILIGGAPKDKAETIDQLVGLMERQGNINDVATYKAAVLAREQQMSTGVENGVAIPHGKSTAVSKPGLAAMTIPAGVDYKSLDGQPTTLAFLIAAPDTEDNVHLQVLASLSQLLVDTELCDRLRAAKTADEFLNILAEAEDAQYVAEQEKKRDIEQRSGQFDVLAITACPTGIAHTYMAAENLEKKAEEMGVSIKVETQGSGGAKNVITAEDVKGAKGVIIAADKNVDLARFAGKPVYSTTVTKGIQEPEVLINKIMNGEAKVYEGDGTAAPAAGDEEGESAWHVIYKHLMNGISHMIPFVVGGGILLALSFMIDGANAGTSVFGTGNTFAAFMFRAGKVAFGFMLPILAGFIAESIADRPGLAVGFVGGEIANLGYNWGNVMNYDADASVSAGFLGAMLAGFIAGYLVEFLKKAFSGMPKSLEGIKPILLYPLCGCFLMAAVQLTINPVMAAINTGISGFLNGLSGANIILLGIICAGMQATDMGGPINKAAYTFGVASLALQTVQGNMIMAAVMAGGMVPPIIIALSTTFAKNRWTEDERQAGLVNYIMGASFITEGAIPFAAADPARVIPSCILGSAVAGGLSMAFGCASPAPHGGLWVIAIITNPLGYIAALAAGAAVGALVLTLLKKPLPPEKSGLAA